MAGPPAPAARPLPLLFPLPLPSRSLLPLLLLLLARAAGARAYFADWGLVGGRPSQPNCVDIPRNMSLCHGIGYTQMRLPNLLDHDTMAEVSHQASSWRPLLNVQCHPDTQLFLCSLFSPVCLDTPIYPCRSLCEMVKLHCEGRMNQYGFPWPDMFKCDKFPLENDMCITPQSSSDATGEGGCRVCNQVETYENILDNFCRADFAVKTKIRQARKTKLTCKKAKVLKGGTEITQQLRRPVLLLEPSDACCEEMTRNSRDVYLIMGRNQDSKLVPSFIMPWGKRSKPFKRAVRMFKKLNCSDPKLVSTSVIGGDAFPTNRATVGTNGHNANTGNNGRRKRGRTKDRRKKNPSTSSTASSSATRAKSSP